MRDVRAQRKGAREPTQRRPGMASHWNGKRRCDLVWGVFLVFILLLVFTFYFLSPFSFVCLFCFMRIFVVRVFVSLSLFPCFWLLEKKHKLRPTYSWWIAAHFDLQKPPSLGSNAMGSAHCTTEYYSFAGLDVLSNIVLALFFWLDYPLADFPLCYMLIMLSR